MTADRQKLVQSAAVGYAGSPDMAAFTIGRVVIAMLAADRPLTASTLQAWLDQIADGDTATLPASVRRMLAALPDPTRYRVRRLSAGTSWALPSPCAPFLILQQNPAAPQAQTGQFSTRG